MDYSITDHTITMPDGVDMSTAEACKLAGIPIPYVDIYVGIERQSRDREIQPMPITDTVLLTEAIPGMLNDDARDIDEEAIALCYADLINRIAEAIGERIMADRFDTLWKGLRQQVAIARGDEDQHIASNIWGEGGCLAIADEDANRIPYVILRAGDGRVELSMTNAVRFAAVILAAADRAKYPDQ